MVRIAARFARVEPRRRVGVMVRGLLGELPRTNCRTVAEQAGGPNPYGLQHLLSRAVWDHDGVRDDLRGYVIERLGDPGAVLVLDETGDVKKGNLTVGVQRQYTGTAGRVENSQVGVYRASTWCTPPRPGTRSSSGPVPAEACQPEVAHLKG
jgi:SRSO17 transposase